MKRALTGSMIVLMVFFLSAGLGLAGNGKGSGNCVGSGTGPIHDIFAGTPFTYEGDVISFVPGQGMELATADGNVTIYGIGPVRYWEYVGVARPGVGETISVSGYAVDYNDVLRNIAVTVTIGEDIVELRDSETGVPLWRGGGSR